MHPVSERAGIGCAARPHLLVVAGVAFLSACSLHPQALPIHYKLNPKTIATLQDADLSGSVDGVAAQIEGALEMLVGTPAAPQYLVLPKWSDDDFDPNYGADRLDEDAFAALRVDNGRRFARQLEILRAAESNPRLYAEIPEPKYAADLWATWRERYDDLVADPKAEVDLGGGEKLTRQEDAVALFTDWYPTLRESAEMYRQQCLHCHGTEGGGDGPTAPFLDPKPRDYRQGKFKWATVIYNTRPLRSDIRRILENGVMGTAMPPFKRYSRGQLEGLVDYVQLLAVRGETETLLAAVTAEAGQLPSDEILADYETIWDKWLEADKNATSFAGEVPREVTPESIEHGRQLFIAEPAKCATCHGLDGRGDGESQYEPSADGSKVKKNDDWGNPSSPRNFYQAILRGGSRPIDLFRRIRNGISGTIMPAADASLSDADVWDLVHFVESLIESHDISRREEAKLAQAASTPVEPHEASETPSDSGH
jgi:mono/diheme cytochrome c family protein